jgi:hypothetical protein
VLAHTNNDLSEVVPCLRTCCRSRRRTLCADSTSPQKRKEKTLKPYWRRSRATGASALAHWFDTTSREALDLIIGQMPRLRVLLIVTYRPEFGLPWVGRSQITTLTLNRLPPRQRAEMIRGMIGSEALPREISDRSLIVLRCSMARERRHLSCEPSRSPAANRPERLSCRFAIS